MIAYFKDVKIGNFIASENGLSMEVDFNASPDEDLDLGMHSSTIEEYIGKETIPLDYGSDHHGKLVFNITFTKNMCGRKNDDMVFSPHEVRHILRELTGKQYYQNLYFLTDINRDDEMIYYRVKVTNTSAKRISKKIVGLIFEFTCDSFWGYTEDQELVLNMKAGQIFNFYNNSDEVNDYLRPTVIISNVKGGSLRITNRNDINEIQPERSDGRVTEITDIGEDEIVTINSDTEQIESSIEGKLIVDSFNLNWLRFIPGRNQIHVDHDCKLTIQYRLLRKVLY